MRRYGKKAAALSLCVILAGTGVMTGVRTVNADAEEAEQTELLTEAQEAEAGQESALTEAETGQESALTEAETGQESAQTEEETGQESAQTDDGDGQETAAQPEKEEQETITKDEMVYVLAGADGSVQKVIVSDWLKNASGSEAIHDRSELHEIENVKGEESFTTGEDNAVVWDAHGSDIWYQGTTDKELPVEVRISYSLDGESIAPEELVGKSGRVTIRFDYTNRQYEEVEMNGQKEKIYVPFAMLTGALFDDETLTNIEVTNGKLIGDGAHTVVVGAAFPGLQEDLKISEERFEIPDYVEISGDAVDFEPGMTVTVATNELVSSLVNEADIDESDIKETLKQSVGDLLEAMDQLESGAGSLASGAGNLDAGAASLQEGMTQLSNGLNKLAGSNDSLNEGAKQVFETLLSTANEQIAASGLEVPELTIENYAATLDGVIASLKADLELGQALGIVLGAGEMQADTDGMQADAAEIQTEPEENSIPADVDGMQASVENGTAADADEMQTNASAEQENPAEMQAKMAAEQEGAAGIQAKLAAAQEGIEALTELKASLDSYNTFYLGLQSYTAGVAKSAEGAGSLKTGTDALKDGSAQLKDGAALLYDGIMTLTGTEKSQSADQTEDSAAEAGAGELLTGAEAREGVEEQGLRNLLETADSDLDGLITRLRAVKKVSENYQSFAGIDESMIGRVRFIYRTDSVNPS